MRNLPGSMLFAGGKKEPKNLDPYMDVLVDELIEMNGSVFLWISTRIFQDQN